MYVLFAHRRDALLFQLQLIYTQKRHHKCENPKIFSSTNDAHLWGSLSPLVLPFAKRAFFGISHSVNHSNEHTKTNALTSDNEVPKRLNNNEYDTQYSVNT